MISVANLKALDEQLNAQIEAANTAVQNCKSLSASDTTAWAGFYSAWSAIHTQWMATKETLLGGINLGGVFVVEYFAQDLYNTMLTYRDPATGLPAWQAKIHAACPDYTIPPSVLVQPAPSDRAGDTLDKAIYAAEVIGGVGAAALLAVVVFKIVNVVRSV